MTAKQIAANVLKMNGGNVDAAIEYVLAPARAGRPMKGKDIRFANNIISALWDVKHPERVGL